MENTKPTPSKQVGILTSAGRDAHGFLNGAPEICRICNSSLSPFPKAFSESIDTWKTFFEKIYQPFYCTGQCGLLHIAVYNLRSEPGNTTHYEFVDLLVAVAPEASAPEVSPEITKLSPNFSIIYKQALATESLHLTQITGIGLRKALEFLVKDYAISKYPHEQAVIEKKPLAHCISEYLTEHYLRECALRATWLGNDETHYLRQWKDLDVQDLKKLILLTLKWLEYSLLSEKYFREMPSRLV